MLSASVGFVLSFAVFSLAGLALLKIGFSQKQEFPVVIAAATLFSSGLLLGFYMFGGMPFAVNHRSSSADLKAGHHYEMLAKVSDAGQREDGGTLFVIKDGDGDKVLLIRIDMGVLPPRFTVGA